MSERILSYRGTRISILVASLVIIIWGIYQAQSVIVVFLVSFFLSVIGTAPVAWMKRKRVPSALAVLTVVAIMALLLLGIGAVAGASLNNFTNAVPFYQDRLRVIMGEFKAFMAGKGITITDKALLAYVNPESMINLTASILTAMSSVLSNTLLTMFTVMFILLEASDFPVKLRVVLRNRKASFSQFTLFVNDIQRYMVIKTSINLAMGVLTTGWLFVLGVDFPILWGFLVFLLHYVPGVGSLAAAIPAVLLAYVQLGGVSAALTAAGYFVLAMVFGNVIEPKIMGHRLGLSTLVVFVSLILWGYLLGLAGALLCVPLTMTLKLACEASDETRWVGVLLGREVSDEVR